MLLEFNGQVFILHVKYTQNNKRQEPQNTIQRGSTNSMSRSMSNANQTIINDNDYNYSHKPHKHKLIQIPKHPKVLSH